MREHLIEVLQAAIPGVDFTVSDTMFHDGILDSLAITGIITEISMEYGISVPFEELVSSNFNSIDSILELIQRCPKNQDFPF